MARSAGVRGLVLTALMAAILLPEFLSAGPIAHKNKAAQSIQERAVAAANHRRLIRNRRNVSWYKQHSDFWAWYKYFTDNGNAEAVQELDRIYLAYLQNKNRAEGRRSYKAYLRHLGDIYKSCSDSDDPNCVAAYTARPKPKAEPPKLVAPIMKTCDPTKEPYCLYMALVQGKSPYAPLVLPVATAAPAPVKAPAPMFVRAAAPSKEDPGYYYYAPAAVPFLSKEQKAELLRICAAEDTECLQYHLRAAYGYTSAAATLPSYAHLGCDPSKDPSCKAKLVQKAPSGLYLQYPNCDPLRDPYCAYAASLVAPRAPNPPSPAGPGSCNPLYEEGCNPLTATRFASPPDSYRQQDRGESAEAAAIRAAPPPPPPAENDPYAMYREPYANANRLPDPYAMYRAAPTPAPRQPDPYAMIRRLMAQAQHSDPYAPRGEDSAAAPSSDPNDPFSVIREAAAAMQQRQRGFSSPPRQQYPFSNHEEAPQEDQRHPLGPPGKTKEGYDCYIGYDPECIPLKPNNNHHQQQPPRFGAPRLALPPQPRVVDDNQQRYLEPANPDCDPEYDADCRLRRYEPEQPEHHEDQQQHHEDIPEPHPDSHRPEQPEQQDPYETEPYQSGQDEPHMPYPDPHMPYPDPHMPYPAANSQNVPTLQDILRRYGDQFPDQDEHRAYADDYRKK